MTEQIEADDGYERCVVTFFDILGFRALLKQRSASEIASMMSTFRLVSASDEPVEPVRRMKDARLVSQPSVEWVSDAIVRSRTVDVQQRSGPLAWELIDLLHIQIDCIRNGILIRGATTIGPMHLGLNFEGPVFGPALVEAYEMEDSEVVYPRIVVMDEALAAHKRDRTLWNEGHSYKDEKRFLDKWLKRDGAGPHYIDYLRASYDEFDDPDIDWPTFLGEHKALVEAGLDVKLPARVKRKYSWLRTYHNEVIDEALGRVKTDAFSQDFEMPVRDLLEGLMISRE